MADPQRLGLLSALYALSMTLGGAAGSPIAGQVLDASGFRLYGLIGSAVIVAAVVAVMLLPAQQPVSDAQPQGRGRRWRWRRRPVVQLLMGLRSLPTLFYGMATVLAPLMINELAGAKTTVALYGAASLLSPCPGAQLLAWRAADRDGHRWPTPICYATLIVVLLGSGALCRAVVVVFFFGILGIAAAWALATLFFVLVSTGAPRAEHGRASACSMPRGASP